MVGWSRERNKLLKIPGFDCGVQPILDCNYDFFKKWDPTRPFCGSSGRHSTGHYGPAHREYFNCKNDFWDDHIYPGTHEQLYRENTALLNSFKSSKQMYEKAYGKKQAFLNSEWGSPLSAEPTWNRDRHWGVFVRPHIKDGDFDRKWLAEKGDFLNHVWFSSSRWAWAPKRVIATDFIETQTILGAGCAASTKLLYAGNRIERIHNYKFPYEYIKSFDKLMEKKEEITECLKKIKSIQPR